MSKIITAILALAIAALANAAEVTVQPSTFDSLKPFEIFKKGAGHGVAREYKSRTKAEFVALLRDKKLAKKEMRVGCEILVRQMMEADSSLAFEGCEGAAAAIENNNDYTVVPCRDEMFQQENWLTVTNENGSAWSVWHRKCLPNEQVLVYDGWPLISLTCLNVAIPTAIEIPEQKLVSSAVATGTCPNGWILRAYAWSLSAMSNDLRKAVESHMSAAQKRDSAEGEALNAYDTDALSRTLSARLLQELKTPAPVNANIIIRYIDSKPGDKLQHKEVETLKMVNGIGDYRFSDDPRTHAAVGTNWPSMFLSPEISGPAQQLERKLRVFPREWVTCGLFVSGIVP